MELKLMELKKLLSCFIAFIILYSVNIQGQQNRPFIKSSDTTVNEQYYRDTYPDTWVGTDALGRTLPTSEEVGPVKNDHRRIVGIFYITWHSDQAYKMKSPYSADVTKILKADPNARLDTYNPLWTEGSYHWGEPESGYFLSKDEYIIREDISMLSNAGVDVMIFDVTNGVTYWDEWSVIFKVMEQMTKEGNKVPKFCFWSFGGAAITVVQDLYDNIYKKGKYKNLWFYWDEKPLLLYNGMPQIDANGGGVNNPNSHYDSTALTNKNNPHFNDPEYTEKFYKDYTKDVKNFFTLRNMWWGYYEWNGKRFVGTEDNWSFGYDLGDEKVKVMDPYDLVSIHKGAKEEAAVTPAQHPYWLIGKSWTRQNGEPQLNQYDLPESTYVPWLGEKVAHPEAYGIYFQDRWNEAIRADPLFIYINDWNEWTAGKYTPKDRPALLGDTGETTHFMRRNNNYYFVDQYNAEFNRSIQPMKGGYTDNYYMQMVENIRRYKGVRPIPILNGLCSIKIDGNFTDWDKMNIEYRDSKGDTFHRDYDGYGGLHYTNNTGRNDIITCKVAVDKDNVYFYAETNEPLTSYTGNNWMLLFIDADKNPNTGWYGYDYLINKKVIDDRTTMLMRYDSTKKAWVDVGKINYRYKGKKLELSVPRKLIGLKGGNSFTFDFHWCDNPVDLKDPISLSTSGDSAPDRRFNYRCIWQK
jgi:hypothetical protein